MLFRSTRRHSSGQKVSPGQRQELAQWALQVLVLAGPVVAPN